MTLFYAINALFFNDDTMHKIYENKGQFDLEYQLPITIYSSLISMFLDSILQLFALSNDNIIEFKQNKEIINIEKRNEKLIFILKIKFILYFIISFILLVFLWYYILMFGAIYKNTQIHLLKDSLLSFVISMITPFIFFLIPSIFRIISLSNKKKNRKYLYIFNKILLYF